MELTISWGDILTLTGGQKHIADAVRAIGVPDGPEELTDPVFVSAGIVIASSDRGSGVGLRQIGTWTVPEVGVLLGSLPWGMVPFHATHDWPYSHTYSMA